MVDSDHSISFESSKKKNMKIIFGLPALNKAKIYC